MSWLDPIEVRQRKQWQRYHGIRPGHGSQLYVGCFVPFALLLAVVAAVLVSLR